jgi:SAM-dependent methyltransferase
MSHTTHKVFDPARFFRKLGRSIDKRVKWWKLKHRFTGGWSVESDDKDFAKRSYQSYDEYLAHQKSKLNIIDLEKYDVRFREALRDRLSKTDVTWRGKTVLCLAARIGSEVKAFIDVGCFAIGIDLNPGEQNHYVVHGDFHSLQYAPESIDFVFTNSLDHAFDIKRIAAEVRRVLKPDGKLIIEAVDGEGEGVSPGFFESFYWQSTNDLIRLFEREGFRLAASEAFDFPWKGRQIRLEKTP